MIRSPQPFSRYARGFTLIELISVLILVGIVSVFAMGRFDASVYRERGFHDSLKSALQFARKAAIAKRRQVCVGVVGGAGGVVSFTVAALAPETEVVACPTATALNLPSRDSGCANANEICAPTGVVLGGNTFYFDAQGRASAGVIFTSTGQTNVTVAQETGYVY